MRSNIFKLKIVNFYIFLLVFILAVCLLPNKKVYAAEGSKPNMNTENLTKEDLDLYAQPRDFKIETVKEKNRYIIRLMWKTPYAGNGFDFNSYMLKFAWWNVSDISNSGVLKGYRINKTDSQGNSSSELASTSIESLATKGDYLTWADLNVPIPTSGTVNYQYSVSSIYDVYVNGFIWVATYTPKTATIIQPLTATNAGTTTSVEKPTLSAKYEADEKKVQYKITLGIKVQPGNVKVELLHRSSTKSNTIIWAPTGDDIKIDANGNATIVKYESATGEDRTVYYKVTASYKKYESIAESESKAINIPGTFKDPTTGKVNQPKITTEANAPPAANSLQTTKPDSGNSQCPCLNQSDTSSGLNPMFITVICDIQCAIGQAIIAIIGMFQTIFSKIPI